MYEFDRMSGKMTIRGVGSVSGADWPEGVRTVEIQEGVLAIGKGAFMNMTGITSVTFPDSLRNIGQLAFAGCTGLSAVELDGVTVADKAFSGCTGVKTLIIGSGTVFDSNSFMNMKGVTVLEYSVNDTHSQNVVNVLKQSNFAKTNGCAVKMLGDRIVSGTFVDKSNVKSVEIGPGVSNIENRAFGGNSGIDKIVYASSSATFSSSPFADIVNKFSIEFKTSCIPANILNGVTNVISVTATQVPTEIGSHAFSDVMCSISIDQSSWSSTLNIRPYAFTNVVGTISILDEARGSYMVHVGENAFSHCTGEIYLGNGSGRGYIESNAFEGCLGMTHTPGISFVEVGDYAFKGCTSLKTAEFGYPLRTVGDNVFEGCPVSKIVYSGISATLSENAFSGITASEVNFEIGDSVMTVPDNMMSGKEDFIVTLGRSVTTVGVNAFAGCTIAEDGMSEAKKLKNIGAGAFKRCNFLNPDLSGLVGLEKIGAEAFMDSNIGKIIIPNAVFELAPNAFDGCIGMSDITLVSTRVSYSVDQSSIFNNTGSADSGLTLHFGPGFTNIPDFAFKGITYLSKVDLDNIVSVGESAFADCLCLDSVVLGSTVKSMGPRMFSGCGISSVIYSAADATVAEGAFSGMTGKEVSFTFDDSVRNIPASVLSGCENCTVTVGSEVESIGDSAFEGCVMSGFDMDGMKSLETIGSRAFAGSTLSNIYIGPNLRSVGTDAFDGCRGVLSVGIYNYDLDYVVDGRSVFAGMQSGEGAELTLGPGITAVPASMFDGAYGVKSVNLDNVKSIGDRAFAETSLRTVTFPEQLTAIGDGAFAGTDDLRNIVFLNPSVSIGKNAFKSSADHLDTNIYSQRHSTAADYPWHEDNRVKHMDFYHVAGEYSGMAEILFNTISAVAGSEVANTVIDFFFDNVALGVAESIDLGDEGKNQMLLLGIALVLLILLFLFLYADVSEGIRTMELIISMMAVIVVAVNSVRMLLEYPGWYSLVSLWVVAGALVPIIYSVRQFRAPRVPYAGETLLRLYSLDNIEIKNIAKGPWNLMGQLVRGRRDPMTGNVHPGKPARILLAVFTVPLGIVASALFSLVFILCHLPAYVFSLILQKLLSKADSRAGRHVQYEVCPECGARFSNTVYRCENTMGDGSVCGEKHTELLSGKYGIHKAVCGKCGSKIRCTYNGRRWEDNVTPLCPCCGAVLNTQEAEPFVVSMVGAVGSGKTSFIGAAFKDMADNAAELGIETRIVHDDTRQIMDDVITGGIAPTLVRSNPPHVCMFSKKGDWEQKAVYVFDPSGESFTDDVFREKYNPEHYTYVDGIVLMINPFSLKDYCERNMLPTDANKDIDAVFEAFLMKFGTITDGDANKRSDVPVAVVLSMNSETGLVPSTLESIDSDYLDGSVREFLIDNGLANLINGLDIGFSNVRYFSCNCPGSNGDMSAFVPLAWIMKHQNVKMKGWFS